MATLEQLIARYLPVSTPECPTFVEDTEWSPILDGADYCTELAGHLAALGSGDAVAIVGLEVDPHLELRGRAAPDPAALALGQQLADAAARGVQVRVLVAGKTLFGLVPPAITGPFSAGVRGVEQLRSWTSTGSSATPLTDQVAIDPTGPVLGSNHQKLVAVLRDGELTAYVGGVDLVPSSRDSAPHDTMRWRGRRWGWHDMAVRLRGPAAARVWDEADRRWRETAGIPPRHYLRFGSRPGLLNPRTLAPAMGDAHQDLRPRQPAAVGAPAGAAPAGAAPAEGAVGTAAARYPGTAVRVLRSVSATKLRSPVPGRRADWAHTPPGGYQEIFATLITAIDAASTYIYIEDQYLEESLGAEQRYELYPRLRAAVERGVKVVFVGSGVRDPEDVGFYLRRINRTVTSDIRSKIVDRVRRAQRGQIVQWRVDHATVHAKLVMIDDVFANIGSANMFARSMSGVDCEISSAVVTTGPLVRELRVRLWAEHLRAPLTDGLRAALEDLPLALGIWRPEWLPDGVEPSTWRELGSPAGFRPTERVLALVGPH